MSKDVLVRLQSAAFVKGARQRTGAFFYCASHHCRQMAPKAVSRRLVNRPRSVSADAAICCRRPLRTWRSRRTSPASAVAAPTNPTASVTASWPRATALRMLRPARETLVPPDKLTAGQIYKALAMYAAANRGVLPIPASVPDYNYPPGGAEPYAIRFVEYGLYNYDEGRLWPFLAAESPHARQDIFLCPSDHEPRYIRNFPQMTANPSYPRNFSYNFTNYMAGSFRRIDQHGTGLRFTQIRNASHKILILEQQMPRAPLGSPASGYAPNETSDPPIGTIPLLTYRHTRKANEGFADGHVDLIDPNIFKGSTAFPWDVDAYHIYTNVFSDR